MTRDVARIARALVAYALLACALFSLGSFGCARTDAPLTIFVAASMEPAMQRIARADRAAHPGADVVVHGAGSQILVAQLLEGAPADVVVTADEVTMQKLVEAGVVRPPVTVAKNRLAWIVPATTTAFTKADLARPGLRLVVCDEAVPAGRAARAAFAQTGVADVAQQRVVSEEDSVAGVVAKVALGEADVGVAYVTDAARTVAVRAIPFGEQDVVVADVRYPAAVVVASSQPERARAFVDALVGARALQDDGFLPP